MKDDNINNSKENEEIKEQEEKNNMIIRSINLLKKISIGGAGGYLVLGALRYNFSATALYGCRGLLRFSYYICNNKKMGKRNV